MFKNLEKLAKPPTGGMVRTERWLDPDEIHDLKLDKWTAVKITGHREYDNDEVRVFFAPLRPNKRWAKSAVQRERNDWRYLFNVLDVDEFSQLHRMVIDVKLYKYLGRTDIADVREHQEVFRERR